ncbi:MAG: MAPEG family protein [Reyranella sp.]|nr:MAPEG family protein [Reyranella sp.]
MVLALAVTVVAFAAALLWPMPVPPARAFTVLGWDLLPAMCLGANIAIIARHRFFTPADIDGSGLTQGTPRVHLYQAMLQNTLEQTALAVSTHLVWAAAMPAGWQTVIAAASVLFLAGRVAFWRGYARGAAARAFGFALTFYPSLLMLATAAVYQGLVLLNRTP